MRGPDRSELERPPSLESLDRRLIEHRLGQGPHHLETGAVALGVNDPAALVPCLPPEGDVAGGSECRSALRGRGADRSRPGPLR